MIIKPSIDSGNGQNVLSFLVNNNQIDKDDISINELFEKYRGAKRLNLLIFDPEKPKVNVRMPSRGSGISINKELLDELSSRDYMKIALNK